MYIACGTQIIPNQKGVLMKKMYKAALAGLFIACVIPSLALAKTPQEAQGKTFNLKHHEKRINAHAKSGKTLSEEFVRVQAGMKKGTYSYDLETARKVMREV